MLSRLRSFFKRHWDLLSQPIYTGTKYEKNLSAMAWFGAICAVFGTLMSVLNIVQNKGFVTVTTIVFAAGGILIMLAAWVFKKRSMAVAVFIVASMFCFSYYMISGANDGFAILWTLLMPLAICYFISVKLGVMMSLYFEILTVVLFYTPIRAYYDGVYTVTFMNRFPIVYLCGLLITTVSMTQYHESILTETEYNKRLNEEVEKQTKVANEQTKVATERAEKLELISEEMVETLARTIDAKDKYTNGHSFRVSEYSVKLAEKLGWSDEDIETLKRCALLHDIGKIGVPDEVLKKPGKLTDSEYESVKSHTTVGMNILEGLDGMTSAAEAAAYHHERYDGKGYPKGLSADKIPAIARIISIADAYDAMKSDRVYRKGLDKDTIRSELVRGSGSQFDPGYLSEYLELLDQGSIDESK